MSASGSRYGKAMKLLLVLALIASLFMAGSFFQMFQALLQGAGTEEAEGKPHLTELRIQGPILSAEDYLASLRRIAKDEHCKGILVRIESPGGAVGASQEIFQALRKLKKQGLPIVVSQANVAASGGYYISLAGDRIFTNPGTLTGSIGVIFQFPEAQKLMEKVGVGLRTIKSGELKDVGNLSRQATPAEIAYLQTVIDDVYSQFLDDILASRRISRDSLLQIADGRIVTGSQAVKWHLADTLGGYENAREYLTKKTGVPAATALVQEPPERKWYEDWVEARSETTLSGLAQLAQAWVPELKPGFYFLLQQP